LLARRISKQEKKRSGELLLAPFLRFFCHEDGLSGEIRLITALGFAWTDAQAQDFQNRRRRDQENFC
jgi:hypothetical protein